MPAPARGRPIAALEHDGVDAAATEHRRGGQTGRPRPHHNVAALYFHQTAVTQPGQPAPPLRDEPVDQSGIEEPSPREPALELRLGRDHGAARTPATIRSSTPPAGDGAGNA